MHVPAIGDAGAKESTVTKREFSAQQLHGYVPTMMSLGSSRVMKRGAGQAGHLGVEEARRDARGAVGRAVDASHTNKRW